ncbi:hypothetical protein BEP19_09255 [Ammoniphilus oxalaticus]|uniref:Uncharacterized protein n=1 Tax=Ammoniphilus oxalaticus TaxID=66863 RepID=A0A419SKU8_9BACL|nr:hypothetical protein [Ammoniphilus oxalaticus]RKD24556.1 hypothetical protein BEP19_09255 [Ammoniphilus oxalaticus]
MQTKKVPITASMIAILIVIGIVMAKSNQDDTDKEVPDDEVLAEVIDRNGVQIELVQPEKIASILIDGQRMMITSERSPIHISAQMLESFYVLLVSNNILTEVEAEKDYMERIKWLKKQSIFTITK